MRLVLVFLVLLCAVSCSVDSSRKETVSNKIELDEIKTPWLVEIFSEQFKWTIRYSGEDNILGKFDYKLTSDSNPLALMTTESIETRLAEVDIELNEMDSMSLYMEVAEEFLAKQKKLQKIQRLLKQMQDKHDPSLDKSALNDVIIADTLVLCVDKEYQFHFRSKDVIHSAFFPHFRIQMNTVPGMTTRFDFTPNETTKDRRVKEKNSSFEFMLMCNKICGKGHYTMKIVVRVVEIEEYNQWMKSQQTNLFKNLTRTLK